MKQTDAMEAAIIKDYLDTHYSRNYDIEEVSRLIFKCPSQAIRIFKKHYNMTPFAYLSALRIKEAKRLLCSTDLSVRDIAFRLGYGDEHYFSAAFKRETGLNPTQFRKNGLL